MTSVSRGCAVACRRRRRPRGIRRPAARRAQSYPNRPVRIVHGYNSGTNPDVISRVIAPALTERLGQPIVVEPKPGSAGRIATGYVATQEPDGHTLMMLTAGDGVTAAFDTRLPYNLLRDYAFIATVVHTSLMLVVSAESSLHSMRDLLDAGKSKPGGLTFGTPGVGTTQHLAGELLKVAAGLELVHVPYRENAFPDLLGGRIDLLIAAPSVSLPQIASARVRALAVTSRNRIDAARERADGRRDIAGLRRVVMARARGAGEDRCGDRRQARRHDAAGAGRRDGAHAAARDRQRGWRPDRRCVPRPRRGRRRQVENPGLEGAAQRVMRRKSKGMRLPCAG